MLVVYGWVKQIDKGGQMKITSQHIPTYVKGMELCSLSHSCLVLGIRFVLFFVPKVSPEVTGLKTTF